MKEYVIIPLVMGYFLVKSLNLVRYILTLILPIIGPFVGNVAILLTGIFFEMTTKKFILI
jgi:hypothetical protein